MAMVALQAAPTNRSSWHLDLGLEDIIVFVGLESLGTLAITGNICLILVLLRNKYLQRASFILMLSLAVADVVHGVVTTSFFYPPIILKMNHMPEMGVRIFNIIDWTAWSITLTHMSGMCLDRLIAIMLYGRYNIIVTVSRVKCFTIFCWLSFTTINVAYILMRVCCLITPLRNNQFYTFGYGEFEDERAKQELPFGAMNLFTFTYSPLELTTIAVLSISNPITLVQLYRRHKRKVALRMASTMLLEMSMRMGSKHLKNDVRELATKRASRQQQRILLQISVVAVIFYLYMTTYYLVYHVFEVTNKWVVLFNSFFYSTTHMINPVIYFSLNKEMRHQLMTVFSEILVKVCGIKPSEADLNPKQSSGPRSSKGNDSGTDSSPLGAPANTTLSVDRARNPLLSAVQHQHSVNSLPNKWAAGHKSNGFPIPDIQLTPAHHEHLLVEGSSQMRRASAHGERVPLLEKRRKSVLDNIIDAIRRWGHKEPEVEQFSLHTNTNPQHSRSMDFFQPHAHVRRVFKSSTVHGFIEISEQFVSRPGVVLTDEISTSRASSSSYQIGPVDDDDIIFL